MNWIVIVGLILAACEKPTPKENDSGLTVAQAQDRFKAIADVTYSMKVDLTQSDAYSGISTLNFNFDTTKGVPVRIDFEDGKVLKLTLNNQETAFVYNGMNISIPAGQLNNGKNSITIEYSKEFSKNGAGLYRFQDPQDGNVYIYSDFEPFDANKFAPLFDQPDLKASYSLSVLTPKSWEVITSVLPSARSAQGDTIVWDFPESKKFSTYIFSLHAGPYFVWKDQYKNIPLRLFARQSYAKYVDASDWFKITKQGLGYFESYFDYPYPFQKYDQLLVPDFNSGAMENVAAITFREGYVPRTKPTIQQREDMADVILHEMAHQWFGNLVTMKWWNGLWLNESFATYMATKATQATEFENGWLSFNETKSWAYWEDGLVTTHPIEVPVPNVEEAFANFDGITYGKGASVLKQLNFYLGEQAFMNGVRNYFKKHQWGSTELSDFFGSLEESSGKNLHQWQEVWIKKSGTNSVKAKFYCKDGLVSQFQIKQYYPKEHPVLRPHRTLVGLYKIENNQWKVIAELPVAYMGRTTDVPEALKLECPNFVFPNVNDLDYVKVILDPVSVKTIVSNLSALKNPLMTSMIWDIFWQMAMDSSMVITEYAELALKNLDLYKHDHQISRRIMSNMVSVLSYLPVEAGQQKLLEKYSSVMHKYFWNNLQTAASDDWKKLYFDRLVDVSNNPETLKVLHEMLAGTIKVSGYEIDQDRRWRLIRQLALFDYPEVLQLIESEKVRDATDSGEKNALAAYVSQPHMGVKEDFFQKVLGGLDKAPLAQLKPGFRNFYSFYHPHIVKNFESKFFVSMSKILAHDDDNLTDWYVESLVPTLCTKDSYKKISRFIKEIEPRSSVSARSLKKANQENDRCVKIKTKLMQ